MLRLLFSADGCAGKCKGGNHDGHKSGAHLQNLSRKERLSRVSNANCHAIFAKQNATGF
jgi:hypothetical protein